MKILFMTENFPPETNAAATRVYERACYWVKWGHEVTVITCAPNFPVGKVFPGYKNSLYHTEMMNGIKVVRMKTFISPNTGVIRRIIDFMSFMISGFIGGIIQPKHDIVVSTSPQFFTAVGAWLISKVRNTPFVFELSDLWPESIVDMGVMKRHWAIRLLEKLELFLYRQSKSVIALTDSFKQNLIERKISPEKIFVILNGVDLHRYGKITKDSTLQSKWKLNDDFVVGYIGTHGMAHGLENVLACAEETQQTENIKFVLVGSGSEKEKLRVKAENMGLSNVIFIPHQPKDVIQKYWSLCDVALIHLRNIPVFGTVIPSKMFEAMAMGLPVLLVSPRGEAQHILEQEGFGIWVEGDNPKLLSETLVTLKQNKKLIGELSMNSLNSAPLHTREKQARDFLSVLINSTK